MEFFLLQNYLFPVKSSFVSSRFFKQPMKVKKIPQMLELTFHVALLRYSDQVVRRICNFQSFIHNLPRFCLSLTTIIDHKHMCGLPLEKLHITCRLAT